MPGRHRAAAAVLLLFGLAGTVEAARLTVGDPGRPGPGFFPLSLAVALSLVALALLVRAPRPIPKTGPAVPEPVHHAKAAGTLLAGVAYACALEPLGFLATTLLLLLFLLRAIEPQPWTLTVTLSSAIALLTYLVFKVWLGVQLPAGPWGF